jgi:hypothetical protein
MGDPRRCSLCGQPAEAYEHAAYLEGEDPAERHELGWLCWACARRHGSHAQFATAMLALAPGVWLVAYPGTPLEARYRLGRHEAAGGADLDQEVQGGEAGRRGQPQA